MLEAFLCLCVTKKALQLPFFFCFFYNKIYNIFHSVNLNLFMVEFEKGQETARNSGTRWQVIEDSNMKIRGSKEVYFH